MPPRGSARRGGPAYFLRFALTASILVAGTLVLVLVVLPQRYVVGARFAESGQNFPEPTVPFVPDEEIRMTAVQLAVPPRAGFVPLGPSEAFWAEALPLLEAEAFDRVLPLFDEYLAQYPDDLSVRRELASTLIAAGDADRAVPVLEAVAAAEPDAGTALLLARTLRDLGRPNAASAHYATLVASTPEDTALWLEWSRAFSWLGLYDDAAGVLFRGLRSAPTSPGIRLELGRLHYFGGHLIEARELLASLSEPELAALGGVGVRDEVQQALHVPPTPIEVAPEPTLLERAAIAREADDFAEARALLGEALDADPDDAAAWLALANLLEYELGDFEGARAALREVERTGRLDRGLEFRLATLEAWTGESGHAASRLEALLAEVEGDATPTAPGDPSASDVRALLGDLSRWDGDRIRAAVWYERALLDEPENERALDGLGSVRSEVDLAIHDAERPGVGGTTFGVGDSDDFRRFDVGGAWRGVSGDWSWSTTAGQRWLDGPPSLAGTLDGLYVEASPARWWRQGTVRTALFVGSEWVRDTDLDAAFGGSVELRPLAGGSYRAELGRRPAYGLTQTAQSAAAEVVEDRLNAQVERPLGDRWSLSVQAGLARLDSRGAAGADRVTRTQATVAAARTVNETLSVGWNATALRYGAAAPTVDGLRLFWDPAAALATGPAVTVRLGDGERWTLTTRLSPGLAAIDERERAGYQTVPQLTGDMRLELDGSRFDTTIDLFYSQARVDGYRSFGVRASVTAPRGLSR